MDRQKAAEAVRAGITVRKGPNLLWKRETDSLLILGRCLERGP